MDSRARRSDAPVLNTSRPAFFKQRPRRRMWSLLNNLLAQRRSRALLYAALSFLLLFIYFFSPHKTIINKLNAGGSKAQHAAVHNRTLGFERVYAIGMAGRTDKRDALTLAASWSEIDIVWNEGVAFEEMPSKAIPEAFANTPNMKPTIIGSWRAHLNVLSRMVAENVQTALILEDDVDWDYNLKAQLEQFALGSIMLQRDDPGTYPVGSPYGSSWDTLWLGHCRAGPSADTQNLYFIRNDTTVPPLPFRRALFQNKHVIPEVFSNDTRILFKAETAGCTFAYAMTLKGARKVLASLSLGGDGVIFDVAMSRMCRGKYIKPYSCYSIYPPLLSSHRFAGSANRDSDIQERKKLRVHGEYTYDVVYSVIQNVPKLLAGATQVASQWPDDTIAFRGIDERYGNQVEPEMQMYDFQTVEANIIPGINVPMAYEEQRVADEPDDK